MRGGRDREEKEGSWKIEMIMKTKCSSFGDSTS